jgi:hypothetical protein
MHVDTLIIILHCSRGICREDLFVEQEYNAPTALQQGVLSMLNIWQQGKKQKQSMSGFAGTTL